MEYMGMEFEAYEGELKKLRVDVETYKNGYEAAMKIVRSTYAERFPNSYFIHGDLGEIDDNGLPDKIMIAPAYGVDWFQIYVKTDETHGPEW